MNEKIKNRVKGWKKIFAEGLEGVDENSSWKDILTTAHLSPLETQKLIARATMECGIFTGAERDFLYAQPHYNDVVRILKKFFVEDMGDIASTDFRDGYRVYFSCYPKVKERRPKVTVSIEAVIVADNPVQLDVDVYTFLSGLFNSKNIIIRYDTQIPQDWLVEKQKYDALEKKKSNNIGFDDGVAF